MRNLTQEQLGEKTGISYKFIGEIERGLVNPSLESLASIAAALRVEVKDLFPGEGDKLLLFSHDDLAVIKKAASVLHNQLNLKSRKLK